MSQDESESRHSTMTLDEVRQEAGNHPGEFATLDLMAHKGVRVRQNDATAG